MSLFDPPNHFAAICTCGQPLTLETVHRDGGKPCFRYEPPDTAHLGKFQGRGQGDTSRRAAVQTYPHSGTQRNRVLGLLLSCPVSGATDEEIANMLRMNPSSVRPRRVELVEGGWVRAKLARDGITPLERACVSGVAAQVWEATRQAREWRGPKP